MDQLKSSMRALWLTLFAVVFLTQSVSATPSLAEPLHSMDNAACEQTHDHGTHAQTFSMESMTLAEECCTLEKHSEKNTHKENPENCPSDCVEMCLSSTTLSVGPEMTMPVDKTIFSRLKITTDIVTSTALDVEISPPQA